MITDEMVDAAWEQLQVSFHEHAEADTGYRAMVKRALTAANAAAWRPIETAPIGPALFGYRNNFGDWYTARFEDKSAPIGYGYTHWQPLPAPPATPEASE